MNKIEIAKQTIGKNFPHYEGILNSYKFEVDNTIPAMAHNKDTIFYGDNLEAMTQEQVNYILLFIVTQISLRHYEDLKGKETMPYMYASNVVVNRTVQNILKDKIFKEEYIPHKDLIPIGKYGDQTLEQIYEDVRQNGY